MLPMLFGRKIISGIVTSEACPTMKNTNKNLKLTLAFFLGGTLAAYAPDTWMPSFHSAWVTLVMTSLAVFMGGVFSAFKQGFAESYEGLAAFHPAHDTFMAQVYHALESFWAMFAVIGQVRLFTFDSSPDGAVHRIMAASSMTLTSVTSFI